MKTKIENYNKGKRGEGVALEYLLKKGFELVEKNYENILGEIDLIMTDHDWLVFVEVKYKTDDFLGLPEEMINKNKLYRIKKVAESYVFLNKPRQVKYRIDAVCILGNQIRHYENITI
ncbi:MAG: YraN family protein [Patescibacteria group bacterium]